MKARIPPEHMLNSRQRAVLTEYYTGVVEQMIEDAKTEFARQYMMMTVICLNESEGFGAKRPTRFLDTLNELRILSRIQQCCAKVTFHGEDRRDKGALKELMQRMSE